MLDCEIIVNGNGYSTCQSTEFTAVWTQQEYTVMESAAIATGETVITFPSGGSTIQLDVQFMFQDISTSGGQRIHIS